MKFSRLLIGAGALGTLGIVAARRAGIDIAFDSLDPEQAVEDGSQFVDWCGVRVRTLSAGNGRPAIVLLHGFAASVFTWHRVFQPLSQLGTVVAFDRPAFGYTTRPVHHHWKGQSPYSLEAQADLTIAMLDHFKIDKAILVGHSAGGTVASLTAQNYPDRVESLILVAPAIYIDVPPPPWLRNLFDTSTMEHVGPWIARTLARYANPIMNRAWHDPRRITPDIRLGYVKPFATRNWDKGMWEAARANRSVGLGQRVGGLKMPTLVMSGDDDHVVPLTQTRQLAAELPHAKLSIIESSGHIPQEEQPQAFLDTVIPFIHSMSR